MSLRDAVLQAYRISCPNGHWRGAYGRIARRYGISDETVRRWVHEAEQEADDETVDVTSVIYTLEHTKALRCYQHPGRGQSIVEIDMATVASSRFYVYILCRPDGSPFYVGKGSRNRVFDHDAEARSGHKCHKCNVIRKVWRNGGAVQRYILLETTNEQEALDYEVELISLYGLNTLTNVTAGGEGASGTKASPKERARLQHMARQRWSDPEQRKRWVEANRRGQRRLLADPEYRAKRVARGKQQFAERLAADPEYQARLIQSSKTPEALEKLRISARRQFADPVARAQLKAQHAAWVGTPEGHAVIQRQNEAKWKDPIVAARMRDGISRARQDPAWRARISEINKAKWADPEYRAAAIAKMKAGRDKKKQIQKDDFDAD